MDQGTRGELISRLAEAIGSVPTAHPLRVAIDGPPASGKTTLADELGVVLTRAGPRGHPREHRRLPRPPCAALPTRPVLGRSVLLRRPRPRRAVPGPARSTGPRRRPKIPTRGLRQRHRHPVVLVPATTAADDAALLFDGVFLLRPELTDRWDLRIFVSVPFEQTTDRARIRGTALAGSTADTADIERSWRHRYIPAQQLYFASARPTDHADIIVYNDQFQRPSWEVRPITV